VGINVLDSAKIEEEQVDFDHLTNIPEVAINVDSVVELAKCEEMLLARMV